MTFNLFYSFVSQALSGTRITVGRQSTCDICLSDPQVSSKHCVIHNTYITDGGSTNGTLLNHHQLPKNVKTLLKKGDVLQLGNVQLFVSDTAPAGAET
jgi:pSer/pThr/pTyr-binding forkhead associated (FHA) protein